MRNMSDEEIREGLVKAYQNILEREDGIIEGLKATLSTKQSSPLVYWDASINLNFHIKWKEAATGLIESLYFEILGEKFGSAKKLDLDLDLPIKKEED